MSETLKRAGARLLGSRWRSFGLAALVVTLIMSAALVFTVAGEASRDSGVRGRVWLGPLFPVQRLGGPPNERPYSATIEVLRAGGDQVVATARSGNDGYFALDLAPGDYVLQGVSPSAFGLPHASPVSVRVLGHRFTNGVTVLFDTGIR